MSHHPVYRDGELHILSEKCSTCIFRPGDLMNLRPKRFKALVAEAEANESVIPCHQTIYERDVEPAVCRGYWDAKSKLIVPLRLAQAMGIVVEDDPPTKETP